MEIRICIDVGNLDRAVTFYATGLGMRVGRRFNDSFVEMLGGSSPIDLILNAGGSRPITGQTTVRDYARHWTPVHLDFVVENLDASVQQVLVAGAKLESPATDRTWGRIAGLVDPFGHGFDLLQFNVPGYDALLPDERSE